jgi:hypothetical protein
MTRNGLSFDEGVRCLLAAAVLLTYSALSFLLIIALLTDWPESLHGGATPLGP